MGSADLAATRPPARDESDAGDAARHANAKGADGTGPDGKGPDGKDPDAYRTITEVAEAVDLPQHVLRFWETRFAQIRPLKRGGGRRYYRREDVDLVRGIRHLLYGEGYTIKGVQRILKDEGARFVQDVWRGAAAPKAAPVESARGAGAEGPFKARPSPAAPPRGREATEGAALDEATARALGGVRERLVDALSVLDRARGDAPWPD